DGNVEGQFTPTGTVYSGYTTTAFTVPAGYHTLTFVGLNPTGGDNTAFVDQVQINVVLSGFGSRGSGFEVPQASTPPPVGFQPLPSEPIWLLPDDPPKKEARKPLWDSGRVAAVGGRTRIVPPEKLAPVCVSNLGRLGAASDWRHS